MEERKQLSFSQRRKIPKLYIKEKIPLYRDNIMKQTLSKKFDIYLDTKIDEKKSIIHDLLVSNFGPNIFKKDKVIDEFKLMFGKYLLNLSAINTDNKLNNLNDNGKKKKTIDEKELTTKINMGNMTYLDFRENIVSKKSLMNDKLFYMSKNLMVSNKEKDILSKFLPSNKKKSKIYNNKIFDSNKANNENINEQKIAETKNPKQNKEQEDNSISIKPFNNSLSQQNILNHKNIINLKKHLINNKNKEENDPETLTSNNQNYFETEKQNNNQLLSNPLFLYNKSCIKNKYETKNDNTYSFFSNSQTHFYRPQFSNFFIPKFNTKNLESEKTQLKPLHLLKNFSDTEISDNMINNQCKSLSTNETNRDKYVHKNNMKRYNSLINLYSKEVLKRFKYNFLYKANLLNKNMKQNNKRLVKIIDYNKGKKIKTDTKQEKKRIDNINLVKSLVDKKTSKKILSKFYKEGKNFKQILKMSQEDDKNINRNKKVELKYFLKNYKNMEDNIALYFVGDLFNTKNIKFQLKEYQEQRNAIKEKMEKEEINRIKKRLITNSYLIRKKRFILMSKNNKDKDK